MVAAAEMARSGKVLSRSRELTMNDDRIVRPSWWYCSIGVAVIVAGLSLFLYTLIRGISHVTDDLTQIVVPGEKDLTLMPHLNYTIFLEAESVVDGRIYSTKESVSGLTCAVKSEASGNKINMRRSTMSTTYSVGGREGRSVLEFVTEEAGAYHIACDYEEGSHGPQVVLAVGSGVGERIFSAVTKSLASFFGGSILGLAIIVTVFTLRERAKREFAASGMTAGPGNLPSGPGEPVSMTNDNASASAILAEAPAVYAGFWLRCAATLIDALAMVFPLLFVTIISSHILEAMLEAKRYDADLALLAWPVISMIFTLIYFSLLESSRRQATLGKMVMGLRVSDMEGQRLTLGRAAGRTLAKYLSCLTFGIGFVMCGFTKKKQALHDVIASCLVLRCRQ
jgi:uncharacterized RDD family membrane protein YckC